MRDLWYNTGMKILSPAGNAESLRAAIHNGADEVYLGINQFNARNNVDGFTIDTLKDAVDYAHIFGVKVLLAINILFDDSELQSALDTVVDAYNLGVDAKRSLQYPIIPFPHILTKTYMNIDFHRCEKKLLCNIFLQV